MTTRQPEFNFSRGDQLALLDAVPIPSVRVGTSKRPVAGGTIKETLRRVEDHCRGDGACWAAADTIAAKMGRDERTVRYSLQALEQLQFVLVERRPGQTNRYRVNWGELSLRANQTTQRDPGHFAQNPGHFAQNPGQSARRTATKRKETSSPSIPHQPAAASAAKVGASSDDWAAVVEDFLSLPGNSRPAVWQSALAAARRTGVSPEHVRRVIQHYRAADGAYQPGALVVRLRACHPGVDPEEGWPEPMTTAQGSPSSVSPAESRRNEWMQLERRIRKAGRQAGASENLIEERVRAACAAFEERYGPEILEGAAT